MDMLSSNLLQKIKYDQHSLDKDSSGKLVNNTTIKDA